MSAAAAYRAALEAHRHASSQLSKAEIRISEFRRAEQNRLHELAAAEHDLDVALGAHELDEITDADLDAARKRVADLEAGNTDDQRRLAALTERLPELRRAERRAMDHLRTMRTAAMQPQIDAARAKAYAAMAKAYEEYATFLSLATSCDLSGIALRGASDEPNSIAGLARAHRLQPDFLPLQSVGGPDRLTDEQLLTILDEQETTK